MARDEDHLARLTSVRSEMEAGVIVGGLEARGIQATMSGIYTTNFRAEAPGWVEVLVAEDDLPRSRLALLQSHLGQDEIDWSQVDVGEPEPDSIPDTIPWLMSLRLWRRIAVALIVIYLLWVGVGLFGGVVEAVRRAVD